MGVFSGIFGPKHPPLPEDHSAHRQLEDNGDSLVAFVDSAHDKIELVTGDGPLYAFVGKPPKAFGIVWFHDGEQHDVRSLTAAGRLAPGAGPRLAAGLGGLYTRHANAPRYTSTVGAHAVTVTPDDAFYSDVHQAVAKEFLPPS